MSEMTEKGGRRDARRGRLSLDGRTVTMSGLGLPEATYGLAELPEQSRDYLALRGLREALRACKDEGAAYAALRAGELPAVGSGRPFGAAWKRAVADVLVEEAAAAGRSLSLGEAERHANSLGRSQLDRLKKNPAVVARYLHHTGTRGPAVSEVLGIGRGAPRSDRNQEGTR